MIDLPPPPPRRIIGKIGSGLEIQAVVGYDYSDLREYGEACVRAALEAAVDKCQWRYVGDNNREDMEARRCADAIRVLIGPQFGGAQK